MYYFVYICIALLIKHLVNMKGSKSLDYFKFGTKKYHSDTKMVSIRLDKDLYDVVKSKNLNLSLSVNALLRGYLYIQNNMNDCPLFGSSAFRGSDIVVDVYYKDSVKL